MSRTFPPFEYTHEKRTLIFYDSDPFCAMGSYHISRPKAMRALTTSAAAWPISTPLQVKSFTHTSRASTKTTPWRLMDSTKDGPTLPVHQA